MDKSKAVAFVGDVHLANHAEYGGKREPNGLNERGRLTIETLREATDRAGEAALVVCGDLFHHRRPEPAIIAAAQACLREDDVILPGNHDLLEATAEGGNTACAVLEKTSMVVNEPTPYEGPAGQIIYLVPFDGRRPMAEVIEDACKMLSTCGHDPGPAALATHVGIVDDSSPPWLRDAPDAISAERLFAIMKRYSIGAAFVGNYHKHGWWKQGGMNIVQLGTLNPTGFGDEGLEGYGGLAFWDGQAIEWESVPGPRFLRLKGQAIPEIPNGCAVYARADKGNGIYEAAPEDNYEEATKRRWHMELVDPAPGVLEEIDAHGPDHVVDSAEDAIKEYVSKAALPEGVSRAELLDEVMKHWRQA